MNVFQKTLFFILCPFVLFAQKKVVKKKKPSPVATAAVANATIQQPLKLWYSNPAQYFEEALVLGNGLQGAGSQVAAGPNADVLIYAAAGNNETPPAIVP